jgi:hypothetical protein
MVPGNIIRLHRYVQLPRKTINRPEAFLKRVDTGQSQRVNPRPVISLANILYGDRLKRVGFRNFRTFGIFRNYKTVKTFRIFRTFGTDRTYGDMLLFETGNVAVKNEKQRSRGRILRDRLDAGKSDGGDRDP